MSKLLTWLTQQVGSPRSEEVLGRIRRGEAGPFLELTQAEQVWLVRCLIDIPSDRLGKLLGVPPRTIRHWRRRWREDQRACRNDEIWRLYQEGMPPKQIAARFGLSERWAREIIRERKRGGRIAYDRFF